MPRSGTFAAGFAFIALLTPISMSQTVVEKGGRRVVVKTEHLPITTDGWLTRWWSWHHWWEANHRMIVLPPKSESAKDEPTATGEQPTTQPNWRELSIQVLLKKLDQGSVPIAAEAALALGRMQADEAVPRLIELTDDAPAAVRRSAWMALGLIDSEASRAYLLKDHQLSEHDTTAWLIAVALLDEPPAQTLRQVFELLKQEQSQPVQRVAAWVLRIHNPPGLRPIMRQVLQRTTDPQLAIEAMLALGAIRDDQDERLLTQVYLDLGDGRDLPSIQWARERYLRVWRSDRAVGGWEDGQFVKPWVMNSSFGPTLVALRTAAAMALAHYVRPERERSEARINFARPYRERDEPVHPHLGEHDLTDQGWLYEYQGVLRTDLGPHAERRWGLIGLGRTGYKDESEILLDVLDWEFIRNSLNVHERRLAPNRGFAAMALGVHMWRSRQPQYITYAHEQRRADKQRRDIRDELVKVIVEPKEPIHLRAACAVAIGMSGDPDFRQTLRSLLGEITPQDEFILSHLMLGMAMLGDKGAIELAERLLPQITPPVDVNTLVKEGRLQLLPATTEMAGRAIALGLGRLGDEAAVPTLLGLFGQDPYISEQAVRSLKWIGSDALAEPLLQLLDHPQTEMAILAAWSMGEMHDPNRTPKLHRLTRDVNITLPNFNAMRYTPAYRSEQSILHRYRLYAAPFLYERLLIGSDIAFWY